MDSHEYRIIVLSSHEYCIIVLSSQNKLVGCPLGVPISYYFIFTVKPVLSSHSKEDQKLLFKTNHCLMQVKSIAKCSKRAFCNTLDLH